VTDANVDLRYTGIVTRSLAVWIVLVVSVFSVWSTSGCVVGSASPPPPTGITKIEEGLAEVSDSEATPFVPIVGAATAQLVVGGQGLTMVVGRLRFSGTGVPASVQVTTQLVDPASGLALASFNGLIDTFAEPSGTARTTRPIYLPGVFDVVKGAVHYNTLVGAISVSQDLSLLPVPPRPTPTCSEAYACVIRSQVGIASTHLCPIGLNTDGAVAFGDLVQCLTPLCPDATGTNICSGTTCVTCVENAVAASCLSLATACMNLP